MDLSPGWCLHPVFHIDKLKKYICSEEFLWGIQLPPPVVVEDHLEFEVQDLTWHRNKGDHWQYLVFWKGYPFFEATWEYEQELRNAPEILEDYLCYNNLLQKREERHRQ